MGAYEISNFARPGFESVHNGHYWRYGEYLGFGAGAVGCRRSHPAGGDFAVRRHNVRNLKKYLEGNILDYEDRIEPKTAMGEFCMLGLRTREGIDGGRFEELFGVGLKEAFDAPLSRARERGRLAQADRYWKLTPDGLLFADEVAASFF
jgi:oxygen-independent coproporphyrinogen-3 oxidase